MELSKFTVINVQGIVEEFEKMKKEPQLVCYEMNSTELAFAVKKFKQSTKEAVLRLFMFQFIFILLLFTVVLILVYPYFAKSMTMSSITLIGSLVMAGFFFLILGFNAVSKFTRIKQTQAEVYLTYSGCYFLGFFYPFRMPVYNLISTDVLEGESGEPTSLRLVIETTNDSLGPQVAKWAGYLTTLEIPLRDEHLNKIESILKSLLSH